MMNEQDRPTPRAAPEIARTIHWAELGAFLQRPTRSSLPQGSRPSGRSPHSTPDTCWLRSGAGKRLKPPVEDSPATRQIRPSTCSAKPPGPRQFLASAWRQNAGLGQRLAPARLATSMPACRENLAAQTHPAARISC